MQCMEKTQRNKLNRKAYVRLCCAVFGRRFFFWHKFEGANALLAQTNKAEQHVGVHEDYGGNNL